MARSDRTNWPVSEDHCFQRIVLDNVCGGVWYEHLDRPAYKHLTRTKPNVQLSFAEVLQMGKQTSNS